MNLALLKQTFKSNFPIWGLTTAIMTGLLAQMITMKQTRMLLGPMFYGMLAPTMIAIFIIVAGNKLLAAQVDKGSMAYILTAPVKRVTVAITQAFYYVASLAATFGIMGVTSVIVDNMVDAGFKSQVLINLAFGSFAVAIAFAGIMFAASGIFNLSKNALGTGGLIILIFLLVAIVASFANYGVSGLKDLQNLTIVSLFDYKNIMVEGTKWLPKLAALGAIGVAGLTAGTTVFTKKDLPL